MQMFDISEIILIKMVQKMEEWYPKVDLNDFDDIGFSTAFARKAKKSLEGFKIKDDQVSKYISKHRKDEKSPFKVKSAKKASLINKIVIIVAGFDYDTFKMNLPDIDIETGKSCLEKIRITPYFEQKQNTPPPNEQKTEATIPQSYPRNWNAEISIEGVYECYVLDADFLDPKYPNQILVHICRFDEDGIGQMMEANTGNILNVGAEGTIAEVGDTVQLQYLKPHTNSQYATQLLHITEINHSKQAITAMQGTDTRAISIGNKIEVNAVFFYRIDKDFDKVKPKKIKLYDFKNEKALYYLMYGVQEQITIKNENIVPPQGLTPITKFYNLNINGFYEYFSNIEGKYIVKLAARLDKFGNGLIKYHNGIFASCKIIGFHNIDTCFRFTLFYSNKTENVTSYLAPYHGGSSIDNNSMLIMYGGDTYQEKRTYFGFEKLLLIKRNDIPFTEENINGFLSQETTFKKTVDEFYDLAHQPITEENKAEIERYQFVWNFFANETHRYQFPLDIKDFGKPTKPVPDLAFQSFCTACYLAQNEGSKEEIRNHLAEAFQHGFGRGLHAEKQQALLKKEVENGALRAYAAWIDFEGLALV